MERASLTMDFLVSLLILTIAGAFFVNFGFLHAENSIMTGVKYKSEAMAMTVGSAINHFAAINPEPGSELHMDLADPEPSAGSLVGGGWPGIGKVYNAECKIGIDDVNDILVVNMTLYRLESDFPESVVARYPLVDVGHSSGMGFQKINCNGTITVDDSMGVSLSD
jgi:hypothetical protein